MPIFKNILFYITLSLCWISCVTVDDDVNDNKQENYRSESPDGDYFTHRPIITISPIDAFPSSLSFELNISRNGKGEIVDRIQYIDWSVNNKDLDFRVFPVEEMERKIEDGIEHSGLSMFLDLEHFYCCLAGVSKHIRIYADEDIDSFSAGENISHLFVVSPEYETLANVVYPEMTPVHMFGEIVDHRPRQLSKIPITEYFSVGTSPLMPISYGCSLDTVDGYENLQEQILDGLVTLHFEIPVIGVNSNGEEESRILTGTISNGEEKAK